MRRGIWARLPALVGLFSFPTCIPDFHRDVLQIAGISHSSFPKLIWFSHYSRIWTQLANERYVDIIIYPEWSFRFSNSGPPIFPFDSHLGEVRKMWESGQNRRLVDLATPRFIYGNEWVSYIEITRIPRWECCESPTCCQRSDVHICTFRYSCCRQQCTILPENSPTYCASLVECPTNQIFGVLGLHASRDLV